MKYNKLPFLRKLYSKFKTQDNEISNLYNEIINLRFQIKKINNEKIKVVFVCWRPSVWGSLKSVYHEMKNDNDFDVQIVVIPNRKELPKLGWNHDIYESEGGENFWQGNDVILGYNYESKDWLDLKTLKPDYVFFQQPYNSQRYATYKSNIVSKYSKICYVAYYAFFNSTTNDYINQGCTPVDFLHDISFYFAQNEKDYNFISNKMKYANNEKVDIVTSGFPRYDAINRESNSNVWKNELSNFKVLWTPRWAMDEGNCHFFKYKDLFLDYCKNNNDVDFVLRPHPQAFLNYVATNSISKEALQNYIDKMKACNNTSIDETSEYIGTFYSSDCLISDTSSMVAEYFLTGKPIIYCYNKNAKNNFSKDEGYTSSFYFVETWEELISVLSDLKAGYDPLKAKRNEYIHSEFFIPECGAASIIKQTIKKDFYKD